jgi:NAD/NADP transhydrogenase beta subunit
MNSGLNDFAFLVATILIIAGLRRLPLSGDQGWRNRLTAGGIALALLTTPFVAGMKAAWIAVIAALAGGCVGGVFAASRLRALDESQIARVIAAVTGLSLVLAAGAVLHQAGATYDSAVAVRDEAWKDVPRKVQEAQGVVTPIPFPSPPDVTLAAGATAFLGMAAVFLGAVLTVKMSDWPGRKSLRSVAAPILPLIGLAFACLFLAIILFGWPQNESVYWVLAVVSGAAGYVGSTMLRRRHAPLVTHGLVAVAAAASTAAGLVVGNILVVIVGAIMAAIFGSLAKVALDAARAVPAEPAAEKLKPPEIATASIAE